VAIVRPFQGIFYDPQRVELGQVVAPPYDVITPADQQRYYRQDPHNVVRLIAGEVRPTDTPEDNKYVRAAGFFTTWLEEGTLRRDSEPAMHVYRHEFLDPLSGERRSRHGILAVVQLEPFGSAVLPHERTHARAKADRLSLTRAVQANLSPVFALYEDPSSALHQLVAPTLSAPARLSFTDENGDRHSVWTLTQPRQLHELAEVFAGSRLYIADGHHRYETALNFRNKMRLDHPEAPVDAGFNFVLMLLVDVRDPGLMILPTNRVLHDLDGFDADRLLERLRAKYRITTRGDRQSMLAAMQEPVDGHRIGLALPMTKGYFTVDIRRRPATDPVSQLDVSLLHREILEEELSVGETMLEQERYVSYSRDLDGVLEKVEQGAAQAAFLLRPPAVADVVAVARAGQVMPQKSTYFFPKPASGIVFNPLDPAIRIRSD
jgi:uncharacterized protein (DUF1015 family)